MNERDRVRLLHMRDAAVTAVRLCGEDPLRSLQESEAVRFATLKLIEIIGEASKSVSPEAREALASVPWGSIARTRDRLTHGYFDIDLVTVAAIVIERLPPLVAALESSLGEPGVR
jgi:uncharacterized protein with HEPN domain